MFRNFCYCCKMWSPAACRKARRIDDPVDRFQVRIYAIQHHAHPTILRTIPWISLLPHRLSPILLLLQFFEFVLLSLFDSFSLFRSLSCILEGTWAKGSVRPLLTVNPTALLSIHSFVVFLKSSDFWHLWYHRYRNSNCKESVQLSLCASPEFTTNLSSFSKTRSLCRWLNP